MRVRFWQELQAAEYHPENLCLLNTELILYGNLHMGLEGWVLLSDFKLVFYKSSTYVCKINFSNPEINLWQFHYISICYMLYLIVLSLVNAHSVSAHRTEEVVWAPYCYMLNNCYLIVPGFPMLPNGWCF